MYKDESVTTAKVLLWEHYDGAVDFGRDTARRSKSKHVDDIVDGIRKVDEHYSDKTSYIYGKRHQNASTCTI